MLGDKWSSSSSLRGSEERGIESVDTGLGRCGELLILAAACAAKKEEGCRRGFHHPSHRALGWDQAPLVCALLAANNWTKLGQERKSGEREPKPPASLMP